MQRTAFRTLATIALAAAAAIPSTMSTSEARTALPSSGRTWSMTDMPCFAMNYGSMTNTCATDKYLEIPLTHDNSISNWLSPRITAQGAAPAGNVGCTVGAIKNDFTAVWSNNNSFLYEFVSVFGTPQDIVLDVFAPGDSGLYVVCRVFPGAKINLLRW